MECEEKDTGVGAGVLSETKTRQENPNDYQFHVIPQDHSKALAEKKNLGIQTWWYKPVLLATWEAEVRGPQTLETSELHNDRMIWSQHG